MCSGHVMNWSDTNALGSAPSLGLNVFFRISYCLFEFIAFSRWLLQCESVYVRLMYYPLLVVHGECTWQCLNFQGVADLSLLNSYVRLAKLRGVWKNCSVVMVDFQRNVINFCLPRIFLHIACCPWFNRQGMGCINVICRSFITLFAAKANVESGE